MFRSLLVWIMVIGYTLASLGDSFSFSVGVETYQYGDSEWIKDYNKRLNLDDARTYCSNFGVSWRLPTIHEIESVGYSNLSNSLFIDVDEYYWTSTPNIYWGEGWFIIYDYSYKSSHNLPNKYNNINRVLCVRNKSDIPQDNITYSAIKDNEKEIDIHTAVEPGWVRHGSSQSSIDFQLALSLTADNDDLITNYCSAHETYIVANGLKVAKQISCKTNTSKKELLLNYRIDSIPFKPYFENATLVICSGEISDGECRNSTSAKGFSVYGTTFSLKRDAYSFANGDWNKAKFRTTIDVNNNVSDTWKADNEIAEEGEVITEYLAADKVEGFWHSIGEQSSLYEKDAGYAWIDKWKKNLAFHDSDGLCYGMALSAISNFTHKGVNGFWETGNFNNSIIKAHWDTSTKSTNIPHKPYGTNNIYKEFDSDSMRAIRQIMYYFVSQESYQNNLNQWTGTHIDADAKDIDDYVKHVLGEVKKNHPVPFLFYFKNKGKNFGHAVVATQIIKYGDTQKVILYNNTNPYAYETIVFKKKQTNSLVYFSIPLKVNKKTSTSTSIGGELTSLAYTQNDPLNIYNNSNTKRRKFVIKTFSKQKSKVRISLNYPLNNHIKVYIVGGTIAEVRKTADNSLVLLRPVGESLDSWKAYRNEVNLFNNTLLLPADETYKITVKKKAGFNTFKMFITIPKTDGTADYLTYDHAETSTKDATEATFIVGRNNTNKRLTRKGASSQLPSFEKEYTLKLQTPSGLSGYIDDGDVYLSWDNHAYENSNYASSVVVRKIGSVATSINDGTVIYQESDNSYTDTNTGYKDYYYSIFNIAQDGEVTDSTSIHIDTSKYSIYGSLYLEWWLKIEGATIKLYNGDKTRLIDTTTSNSNASYSFNNILNGDYVLVFSHPEWSFEEYKEISVTVNNGSEEIYVSNAREIPRIYMDVSNTVDVGKVYNIIWDGNLFYDEKVTIKLYRNKKWETIARNISYDKQLYKWRISGEGGEAKLRVEVAGKTFSDKDIFIINNRDTDKDGIPDYADKDDDNDGLSDIVELKYGLNPLKASDAQADFDHDGFSNTIEISMGTNIRNARSKPIWAPIMMGDIVTFVPAKP